MVISPLSGSAYTGGASGKQALLSGVTNITWCPAIPVVDYDQVLLLVEVNTAAGGANAPVLQLQYSHDGNNWFSELIEEMGALSAGERRFTCNTKAWGPLGVGSYAIPRPASAHFLRIGVYSIGSPAPVDFTQITIERQAFGQLGAAGVA